MTRGRIRTGPLLACLMAALAVPGRAAEGPGNPYQGIVDRNLFNLKPPLRPEDNLPPAPPPPKITLTGFTSILGNKRVLFKIQEPLRPPQPAKEEFFILSEGQREGDIEVVEIDDDDGTATFNNHGTVQKLSLDANGQKPQKNPPGGPPQPGIPNQLPPRLPGSPAGTIPIRSLRVPPPPGMPESRMNPAPRPSWPGAPPPAQ